MDTPLSDDQRMIRDSVAGYLRDRYDDAERRRIIDSEAGWSAAHWRAFAGELGLPNTIDPTVRERCAFSCDQGTSPAELKRRWPDLDFSGVEELWWGGVIESWTSLAARCATFRSKLRAAPDRHEVCVVSHWGFIRGLTGAELHNTESIRLTWDEAPEFT